MTGQHMLLACGLLSWLCHCCFSPDESEKIDLWMEGRETRLGEKKHMKPEAGREEEGEGRACDEPWRGTRSFEYGMDDTADGEGKEDGGR